MRIVEFAGRPNNAELNCGPFRVVVTLDVGPRILSFSRDGGESPLRVYEKHEGLIGGDEYRSYGGHRFWIAPEIAGRTTAPDNHAVEMSEDGEWTHFMAPVDAAGMQKRLSIRGIENGIEIIHRVQLQREDLFHVAPWGVTVMKPGGYCVWPLPTPKQGTGELLPTSSLVLWRYTDLCDPRLRFVNGFGELHNADAGPIKVGMPLEEGWAAYQWQGQSFLKTFDAERYDRVEGTSLGVDQGANFEVYTRSDMLEVESLGRGKHLKVGEALSHTERWTLGPEKAAEELRTMAQALKSQP
ncbi:MAG: hypothetical protein JST35_03820 [Armatimonadetes bacterium]|nr:hypothetical protein [Armatimonadota bacterium]